MNQSRGLPSQEDNPYLDFDDILSGYIVKSKLFSGATRTMPEDRMTFGDLSRLPSFKKKPFRPIRQRCFLPQATSVIQGVVEAPLSEESMAPGQFSQSKTATSSIKNSFTTNNVQNLIKEEVQNVTESITDSVDIKIENMASNILSQSFVNNSNSSVVHDHLTASNNLTIEQINQLEKNTLLISNTQHNTNTQILQELHSVVQQIEASQEEVEKVKQEFQRENNSIKDFLNR